MKKYFLLLTLCIVVGCSSPKEKQQVQSVVTLETKSEQTPSWVVQNIDTLNACAILPCDGMNFIKVGNSYTATFHIGSVKFYKVDYNNTGLDFDLSSSRIQYFGDSCSLKESLRKFIKMQMVKYIQIKINQ